MSADGGVFIGLGANLGDRADTIARAVECLRAQPDIEIVRVSTLHRTAPWRVLDQPEFLNAVVEIATQLPPAKLVLRLLTIERELGRERADAARWSARIIDLDLLLFGDRIVDEPGCRVPHPHLHEREFALRPLLEIAPSVVIPGRGSASDWLDQLESKPEAATA